MSRIPGHVLARGVYYANARMPGGQRPLFSVDGDNMINRLAFPFEDGSWAVINPHELKKCLCKDGSIEWVEGLGPEVIRLMEAEIDPSLPEPLAEEKAN